MTKQNCVTLWEKDAEGNQVWAGKEGCEPVTWQECKLVDKEVKFLVPEIICSPKVGNSDNSCCCCDDDLTPGGTVVP